MALVEKLAALKLPFVAKQRPEDDEKLMQLFRNRAGLKKAHASLQDELYELKDRLKQQEGLTTRAQEDLDALGTLLGNPEAGFNALVYFQLRGLWNACRYQLEVFAAELERQQEDRERRKQLSEFNLLQRSRLDQVDAALAGAERTLEEQNTARGEIEQRIARMRGFWNYFRRRRTRHELDVLRGPIAEAERRCTETREEHAQIEAEQCAPFPGLSVDGKRAINLATIAYSLVLGVRLSTHGLAVRTKDAMARRVQESTYGTREDCDGLMMAMAQALAAVKSRRDVAGEIKGCVDMLRQAAQYRSQGDAVPLAESLAAVIPPNPGGRAILALSAPQVLADDYWNIYRVLLR